MTGNLEAESLHQCMINLFGHTHQQFNFYQDMPFMYHVGCDSHNNTPVLLDDIIDEIKAKDGFDTDSPILSMGMSDSYRVAIEEGSTAVRIGRRLFLK